MKRIGLVMAAAVALFIAVTAMVSGVGWLQAGDTGPGVLARPTWMMPHEAHSTAACARFVQIFRNQPALVRNVHCPVSHA